MRYIWLLILFVLMLPTVAQAQSAVELHWERYDNIVQIQPDGSVRIEEQQRLVIDRGRVNFMDRNFATGSDGRVTEIQVYEDGAPYREGSSGAGTFSGSDNGDEARIRINFRDNSDTQHDLTIAYTIENTLIDRGDLAEFRWNFFWSGQAPPIENGSVEIRFPSAIAADQIAANGSGVDFEQRSIENGVRWELTQPIQGQELVVQAAFPKTGLAANAQFRSNSAAIPQPETGVTDPGAALAPVAGIGIAGILLCAFVLVMLFIAFSAISASARRRAARGYPQPPTYGPGPFDEGYGPFGPQPRRRRRRHRGWGGGWGIPPIIIRPPYRRPDRHYDNNPTDRGGDDGPWDDSGGGGSSWDDSGGGGSSWDDSGGGGSSWGGFGGGGGSSWGGGGGGGNRGGGGGNRGGGGGSGGGGFG